MLRCLAVKRAGALEFNGSEMFKLYFQGDSYDTLMLLFICDNNWKGDTVKPVLTCLSKIDKTKVLMTNGGLLQVESIAECSPWSILQYF